MKIKSKLSLLFAMLIFISFVKLSPMAYAGGYYITDKDGKVISGHPEKIIAVGPTDRTIVFTDSGERKVFDVTWDAEEKTLVIKGDNVHLKIYNSGKIEKWGPLKNAEQEKYPLFIEPVVPIHPRR